MPGKKKRRPAGDRRRDEKHNKTFDNKNIHDYPTNASLIIEAGDCAAAQADWAWFDANPDRSWRARPALAPERDLPGARDWVLAQRLNDRALFRRFFPSFGHDMSGMSDESCASVARLLDNPPTPEEAAQLLGRLSREWGMA